MKHVKTFETHSEQSVDIKNEYSKIVNSPKGKVIELGKVGQVDDSTIYNLKQTYKNSILKVVNDRYVLFLNESVTMDSEKRAYDIKNRINDLINDENEDDGDELEHLLDELSDMGWVYDDESMDVYPDYAANSDFDDDYGDENINM